MAHSSPRRRSCQVCSEDAGIDQGGPPFRDRHPHPHLVAAHLLPRRDRAFRGHLPRPVPEVVARKGAGGLGGDGAALLRLGACARARALARGAAIPDVGLVDHAVPARRRREPDARAAIRARRVLHGGCGTVHEHRHRSRRAGSGNGHRVFARSDPIGAPGGLRGRELPGLDQHPGRWIQPDPRLSAGRRQGPALRDLGHRRRSHPRDPRRRAPRAGRRRTLPAAGRQLPVRLQLRDLRDPARAEPGAGILVRAHRLFPLQRREPIASAGADHVGHRRRESRAAHDDRLSLDDQRHQRRRADPRRRSPVEPARDTGPRG